MENPFKDMKDDEFLYQMCAFVGKDNFIRFANLTGAKCPNDDGCVGVEDCGECFYKFLSDYEKNNKTL